MTVKEVLHGKSLPRKVPPVALQGRSSRRGHRLTLREAIQKKKQENLLKSIRVSEQPVGLNKKKERQLISQSW